MMHVAAAGCVAAAVAVAVVAARSTHAPPPHTPLPTYAPALLAPPRAPWDLGRAVADLLAAAAARWPWDARLHRARQAIRGVERFDDKDMVNWERMTVRRGKFFRDSGILRLSTTRHDGRELDPAIVRGVLVHEVAHAALDDGKHSPAWRDMYVRLLQVATQDLGWDVSLERGSCPYYGVCERHECPRCRWPVSAGC